MKGGFTMIQLVLLFALLVGCVAEKPAVAPLRVDSVPPVTVDPIALRNACVYLKDFDHYYCVDQDGKLVEPETRMYREKK
jgi:hypothetical protein